ncbi:MAG: RNA-binding S4 domain-containing protein [Herbinix sp.]|nr:RNA-binding S4 domain-containing protein [Herbinix sp.]
MHQIKLREDYIKLGQALKAAGLVGSGVDAKNEILDGKVKVNNAIEIQRGKKLYDGDIVEYAGEKIKIEK